MGGLCAVALVAITGLFALLGRLLRDAMNAVPHLDGDAVRLLLKGRGSANRGLARISRHEGAKTRKTAIEVRATTISADDV